MIWQPLNQWNVTNANQQKRKFQQKLLSWISNLYLMSSISWYLGEPKQFLPLGNEKYEYILYINPVDMVDGKQMPCRIFA